jgi:NAD(P)-dependent dehydrogenase (short-subunit alcohol dehydrogenase family)
MKLDDRAGCEQLAHDFAAANGGKLDVLINNSGASTGLSLRSVFPPDSLRAGSA